MNTGLFRKSLSRVLQNEKAITALEVLFLFLCGIVAVILHARFRIPLKLPGHHGFEFMAIFVMARAASRYPFAASVSGAGAATFLLIPGLGFSDPFMAFVFFIPGILLDLLSLILHKSGKKVLFTALFAGIAYTSIPFTRVLLSMILVIPYKSLLAGPIWPLISHFLFGALGGLCGAGIIAQINRKKKTQ